MPASDSGATYTSGRRPKAAKIVESYGGTIWAENRHRGAVFSFTIPLGRAQVG